MLIARSLEVKARTTALTMMILGIRTATDDDDYDDDRAWSHLDNAVSLTG